MIGSYLQDTQPVKNNKKQRQLIDFSPFPIIVEKGRHDKFLVKTPNSILISVEYPNYAWYDPRFADGKVPTRECDYFTGKLLQFRTVFSNLMFTHL